MTPGFRSQRQIDELARRSAQGRPDPMPDEPIAWAWALILLGCSLAMLVMWWFDLFDKAGGAR